MARRQGAAGRRGAEEALSPVEVGVHDLSQARAALAAAAGLEVAIQLRSAPDAAAYAGVGYLQALGTAAGHELLIDCGDDPALVMAALRTGCRKLAFSGSAELAEKLADLAAQHGATLRHETAPPDALLLPAGADPGPALQAVSRQARAAGHDVGRTASPHSISRIFAYIKAGRRLARRAVARRAKHRHC